MELYVAICVTWQGRCFIIEVALFFDRAIWIKEAQLISLILSTSNTAVKSKRFLSQRYDPETGFIPGI